MRRFLVVLMFVVLGASLTVSPVASPQLSSSAAPNRALLDQYCVTCHSERAKTAGLMLDKMDIDHVADGAETWEKVIRKLRGGMMPPIGHPRPGSDDLYKLISYFETSLDRAGLAKPN